MNLSGYGFPFGGMVIFEMFKSIKFNYIVNILFFCPSPKIVYTCPAIHPCKLYVNRTYQIFDLFYNGKFMYRPMNGL